MEEAIPPAAESADEPKDIFIEQLYLTGLHLEQYRHATFNPADYYEEALSKIRETSVVTTRWDSFDERGSSNRLNLFDKAIETLTKRNPNPYDGEPYYNRGAA